MCGHLGAQADGGRLLQVHNHVALAAGVNSSGQAVHEQVPAERLADAKYRLLGTPGLAIGCAAGDVLSVSEEGGFEVVARGGNLSVLVYGQGLAEVCGALRRAFSALGGTVEAPDDFRFVVVTVPVAAGFANVERAVVAAINDAPGVQWFYGNVYDELDQPLNWWADEPPS